jgi:hypothetical protein
MKTETYEFIFVTDVLSHIERRLDEIEIHSKVVSIVIAPKGKKFIGTITFTR